MKRLRRALIILARAPLAGWLVREVFAHMSFVIPVKRLRETPSLLAFFHPSPSYPFHVLLVPRRSYRSLLDVPAGELDFQRDLFAVVQSLVREYDLEKAGYRLIANGGPFQEVPLLHFHLVSDRALRETAP